jgi:hypothetical protein
MVLEIYILVTVSEILVEVSELFLNLEKNIQKKSGVSQMNFWCPKSFTEENVSKLKFNY